MNNFSKLSLAVALAFSFNALASDNSKFNVSSSQWQPVASDKLIQLPVNIIEKRIQQDFQASPMAMRMSELESLMQDKVGNIKALQKSLPDRAGEALLNQKYEALQEKSAYLDLLQESHALRQSALGKKQKLYKNVLNKMRHHTGKIANSDAYEIKQAQVVARLRMEKVIAQVDQALMHSAMEKPSPYADEYSKNLNQIEKLKIALNKHSANASPQLNGVDITSEEYIRQLLMSVSTEQSLLDQESLMLSYMAKLVALDAQSLEYEVAYGENDNTQLASEVKQASKPANVTNLFYQE
jgi:hypothetical protein